MTIPETVDDMGRTTIQVSDELADELHDRKNRGDSYEDVIWRLIDQKEDDEDHPITCNKCGAAMEKKRGPIDGAQEDYIECPECGYKEILP
jgi:predicted CopG family antitoxin